MNSDCCLFSKFSCVYAYYSYFPISQCLFETNVTQSIRSVNSVQHGRQITASRSIVQKRISTLKTHQMFFSILAQYARKIYKSNNPGYAGLDENSGREIICLWCCDRSKSSVLRGLFVSVQMFFIDIFPHLTELFKPV